MDFPSEYSMGELYLLDRNASQDESEPGTTTHFAARGRLKFPPGTRAILKLRYEGSQHMSELGRLKPNSLFGINMKRMEVTDDDLKHVAKLTGLVHIELEGTDITSRGVFNLEPLKNLHYLGVDKTLIKSDAMKSIGRHSALVNLIVGHNELDDECYKDLLNLKNMTNLQVDNVHLSDKGFDYIVKLPKLAVLKVSANNRIGDNSMSKLQNSKIEYINVQNTGVGPRSIPYFLKMPVLKCLKLERRNFSAQQQKDVVQKLKHVKIDFRGKERDIPQGFFDPLH